LANITEVTWWGFWSCRQAVCLHYRSCATLPKKGSRSPLKKLWSTILAVFQVQSPHGSHNLIKTETSPYHYNYCENGNKHFLNHTKRKKD